MTAVRSFGTVIAARYVTRARGESCSGMQVRAWMGWKWEKRNGWRLPSVWAGSSQ
jgi:hypothetical protein